MAFTVEDGTVVSGANSYCLESQFETYCDNRGIVPESGDVEQALVRGTFYVDAHYRRRFPGTRASGRDQELEWPRSDATDLDGETIDSDIIPVEIRNAVCEAALRELETPGSLSPDLKRGGLISSVTAGSVAVTFAGGAKATTTYQRIDQCLNGLIRTGQVLSGSLTRG